MCDKRIQIHPNLFQSDSWNRMSKEDTKTNSKVLENKKGKWFTTNCRTRKENDEN